MNAEIERLLKLARSNLDDGEHGAALRDLMTAIGQLARQVEDQEQRLLKLAHQTLAKAPRA